MQQKKTLSKRSRRNNVKQISDLRCVSVTPTKTKVLRNNRLKTTLKIDESEMSRTSGQQAAAKCKIFRLNDDCLLEIFSHLSTIDLCAIKISCHRFNYLADSTIKRRFRKEKGFKCKSKEFNENSVPFR